MLNICTSNYILFIKNRPARHACVYRWRVWNVLLATSVGDVTRLNIANVVRFSLYIWLIGKLFIVDIFVDICEEKVELLVKGRE